MRRTKKAKTVVVDVVIFCEKCCARLLAVQENKKMCKYLGVTARSKYQPNRKNAIDSSGKSNSSDLRIVVKKGFK